MKDVMIDIETISTRNNALILSIGLKGFKLTSAKPLFDASLLLLPSITEQFTYARHVDMETVKWWADKGKMAARKHWLPETTRRPLDVTLRQLTTYVQGKRVWAHGIGFDISNLESLYEQVGLSVPWKYNEVMDERTVIKHNPQFRSGPPGSLVDTTFHDPVSDAIVAIWNLWEHTPEDAFVS